MRIAVSFVIVGGALVASTVLAAPASLTAAQTKSLDQRGYRTPALVFDSSPIRIASGTKRGKRWLVVLGAKDQIVDAGPVGVGTLSIAASTRAPATALASATPGHTMVEVSYKTPRANGGSDTSGVMWLVRDDGSIACKVPGNSSTNLGSGCGSSGWTTAEPTTQVGANGELTLEVRYSMSGNYSTPDGPRGCLHRSPVRSSRTERWIVPARGTCKKQKL